MAKVVTAPPETWRLVARALATRGGRAERPSPADAIDLASVDGAAFLPFAADHGVVSLLDLRVAEGAVTGLCEATRQALRAQALREAAMHLALEHSLSGLWDLLSDHGFELLLLKGAALALDVYPEGRLRTRCDADLWIRADAAVRVMETLRDHGYSLVNTELATRSRGQFQATREGFQGEPLWFDIHHRLSNRVLLMDALDFRACLAGATTIPRGASHRPYVIPGLPELLLHACMHRIGHGRGCARERLIWLYDIHLLHESMRPEQRLQFTQLALEGRLGCLCADALRTSQAAFGTEVSAAQLDALTARSREEPSAALLDAGRWRWALADLLGQPTLGNKLRFAGELLHNRFG